MTKTPTIIGVSKLQAGFFYVLIFAVSLMAMLSSNSGTPEPSFFMRVAALLGEIFGLIIGSLGIISLFSKRFAYGDNGNSSNYRQSNIAITEHSIVYSSVETNASEEILWENVDRVEVLTTDHGPAVCDVFFVISDSNSRTITIPQDIPESKLALDVILKLPGFNYEEFIKAMSCAENNVFLVWQKKTSATATS